MAWTYFSTADRARLAKIQSDVADLKQEIAKMAVDVTALTAAVAAEETAEAGAVAALNEIVTELQALRAQGGGALQTQIDSLTQRLQATSAALSAGTSAAVAAEQPASTTTPAP